MQFLLENWNWVWVVTALASGGMLAWPALTRGAGGNGVSPAEAVRLMNREKAVAVAGGTAAWREASLPIEKSG